MKSWIVPILVAALLLPFVPSERRFGEFGTNDFIEYWTAFQAISEGFNPYDPSTLLRLQQHVGREDPLALMMWNPPWTLTLLSPFLVKTFSDASTRFLALNFVLLAFFCELARQLVSKTISRRISPTLLLGAVASYAIYLTLSLGQIGLLLTVGIVIFVMGVAERKSFLLSVGALLISLKPHFFLLLGIFVIWRAWKLKEFRSLVCMCATVGTAAIITEAHWPDITARWLYALTSTEPSSATVPVAFWQGSTLLSFLRERFGLGAASWPIRTFSFLTITGYIGYLSVSRRASLGTLGALDATMLSAVFSPFGWLFDFSILSIHGVFISASTLHLKGVMRFGGFAAVLFLNCVTLLYASSPRSYLDFWWYGPGYATLWFLFRASLLNDGNILRGAIGRERQ